MTHEISYGDVKIAKLELNDVSQAAKLHCQIFTEEFLSRAGPFFMRQYYRAWLLSHYQLSFVAKDSDKNILGVLLANYNPSMHYSDILKKSGMRIVFALVVSVFLRPKFGWEVVSKRLKYYVLGVLKRIKKKNQDTSKSDVSSDIVAELTHLFVVPEARGKSIGSKLVKEFETKAQEVKVKTVELVTPIGSQAIDFYERLNYKKDGIITSRANERFVKFIKDLPIK